VVSPALTGCEAKRHWGWLAPLTRRGAMRTPDGRACAPLSGIGPPLIWRPSSTAFLRDRIEESRTPDKPDLGLW
jgi:hypothetical protein